MQKWLYCGFQILQTFCCHYERNRYCSYIYSPFLFTRLPIIYSFIHSFIHSFICSFVRVFVCSFVRLFVCSCVRLFVCSFVRLFVCSFVRLFVCSFVRLFVCSFIRLFACSFVRLLLLVRKATLSLARLFTRPYQVSVLLGARAWQPDAMTTTAANAARVKSSAKSDGSDTCLPKMVKVPSISFSMTLSTWF